MKAYLRRRRVRAAVPFEMLAAQALLCVEAAEQIAEAMQRRGIDQAGLAELLGCRKRHVERMMRGHMTLQELVAARYVLGILRLHTVEALLRDAAVEADQPPVE